MRVVESNDDYPIDDIRAPQVFARNFEWMTFEDTGIKPEELPRPTTWHVLVMPKQPRKMTKGGIALPEQVQDIVAHQNYIGQVVAMGPLAGRHEKFLNPDYGVHPDKLRVLYQTVFEQGGQWDEFEKNCAATSPDIPRYLWNVKVGDWVVYGKYAGMSKTFKGVRFLTINDDAITDIIDSPEGFAVLT